VNADSDSDLAALPSPPEDELPSPRGQEPFGLGGLRSSPPLAQPPQAVTIDASLGAARQGGELNLGDLDAIRLILGGNSVIDWNRSHFQSLDDVDRFLRLHLLDPSDPTDRQRLRFVHGEAVSYLEEHLGLHFPDDLREPEDVRQLFLLASQTGGFRRRQIFACVILKLMHVINHMEAAELHFQSPLSEARILDLAERRIMAAADQMRAEGFPLVAFYGSRKTRNSIITKLIAKKENIAATIFDKLRFRIVTKDQDHILPAIGWLTRNLFPFNYVIPGQSHNNLIPLPEALRLIGSPYSVGDLQGPVQSPELVAEDNPFSGDSYRIVNFIVDFPVRIDDAQTARYGALLGRTVFALVEFQIIDRETARANEEGENAHNLYKERQRAIVARRLKKGGAARRRGRTAPGEKET
jgi:uncharacterized protein (TIGR04552 family)